jgi:hypothetical protein
VFLKKSRKTECGAKRFLAGFGGARRTLCAFEEVAQNGVRRETVPGRFGGAHRTLCASSRLLKKALVTDSLTVAAR